VAAKRDHAPFAARALVIGPDFAGVTADIPT